MDFKVVEAKWQKFWEEHPGLYRADDDSDKEKKYILVEFPYPSGSGLHVGHAFSFTGSDIYARFKRMQGYDVMFPMGWDAFGLPTENYAIKSKRKPQEVTKENIEMFKGQMKRLAYSFDWEREVNTSDPNYYKWTQWIFIQLFKKGLAYKKEMPINWCPSCKTGLANEEVVNGKCERCGAEVERRTISQWVVKITEYADKLIEGLEKTEFIDKVKRAQINWIGKSEGAKIRFQISDSQLKIKELEVFTTRPDTLYGATFMVIAPEHELALELSKRDEKIKNYLNESRKKSEMERAELNKEKNGVFSGLYAINPINNKEIPVWISDFVLSSYGTGAIMSVPAHDERDHAFAKKYKLSIIPVISKENWNFEEKACSEANSGVMINSPKWEGLKPEEAIKKAIGWLTENKIGEKSNSYHLRDWIFSRQHYWGEPIPMIYCQKDGWQAVPEEDLPIQLPEIEVYEPTEDGKSPLSKIENFVRCKCPICEGEARRETDTMPNWAGSDWYYLAYCFAKKLKNGGQDNFNSDLDSNRVFVDIFSNSSKELKKWCPVDVYVGGDEHNTLHLLYSRFIYQFLSEIGVLPNELPEPYYKRISHGVILGPDNQRMSKSKGNVIVPETVIDIYGVDVLRMYLMFMGPFEGVMAWNEKTLMGVKRFLDRFSLLIDNQIKLGLDSSEKSKVLINKTIQGISRDYESFGFNTAVAKLMEAVNRLDLMGKEELKVMVQLLSPMAPHTAEELWQRLGGKGSVHQSSWPIHDKKYLNKDKISLPIAINGKVREVIELDTERVNDKEYLMSAIESSEKLMKWLEGKEIVKEILVPGKMLNLVIKG
ncbi:MAG: Leucine-tRNA ligase [Candidatus Shapirobacteria bacterium GW2011_GWE1_38_10]|uniref:Leucine--tRNA ligase n=1 Tax=Candidatus Shapirobacteria bacterium GW2011_GWE1_38_10 TaxID=1618488 RepID=A0A0G0I8J9_9BACT|nr:MAG: Leucine-tRNA ligase [Candidatus Shapirobacteria bacterium GW2011_GWF2_37_20]KKQ50867.1 MAG: Leucine-tRNA ligase [Candidatus Shapirobacteria bacterium GW2011_GWE1_38_10]KKQ63635.1 MAG: Leucine-tRNA ligase [Candidatus Shapirobacteria bacterium GW2011_GWF1_38_23]HBP51079.1 leucine--tRNA ligase [Candidatus Shapirobacteria bacterium]